MVEAMQALIIAAYGEKSADGKVFKKNKEITENFACSAAFAQLMDDIMYNTNADMIQKIMINIFPSKFAATIKEEIEKKKKADTEKVTGEVVD